MSTYETPRTASVEDRLAILETLSRQNNVRFSDLTERLSLDEAVAYDALTDLRNADLVSTCPLRGEDDSIVASLPRLRAQERTKLHRLLYN
ncbi:hypothetical protein [Halalkalicoccus sp. NIPERK01]|uniref:hypothetical protein n=1 Tax=Halalkalicoccus sp. NIPERK01 TaxID=3053469 RepID=UPI00256F47C1|nr:hypothetical protein [Halalkalicoccus sp. NIPERK01]MDL5362140.1 hypothetical protein [Halalkalicoccus sp. NIPERK01]